MASRSRDLIARLPSPTMPRPEVVIAIGAAVTAVAFVLGLATYLIALGIIIPLLVAASRRPQLGVLALAALLPFNGLLIITPLPSSAGGWKEAFVLLILAFTFTCPPEARGTPGRKMPGWVPAVVGLFGLSLLTVAFVDPITAITGLRISFFNLLLAWAVWRCPLSRRERDRLVTIFITVGFITAVYGLVQQMVGHVTLHSWGYPYNTTIRFTSGFRLRSFSTFNLPFPFAFYLMLVILIGLPFSLGDPGRLRSKLFFLASPVMLLGMIFAYVRASWLGLAVGLLYLAFHRYKILVYGIPLALVAVLFLPAGSTFTTAATQSNSLAVRTTSWGDRFHQIVAHPLGTGVGSTGAAAEKAATLGAKLSANSFQPDNSYLKITFELGVVGLWLFLMLLVSSFLGARWVERRVSDPDRHFAAGVAAQILAIMAASTVATYFEMIPMDALWWLMITIVATMAPRMDAFPGRRQESGALSAPPD